MIDYAALADEFGTPLFVYEADTLAAQYAGLRDRLHPAVDIFYSLKANPNVAICGLLHSLGAGAEVSSLLELRTARQAGVPARDIVFPGPGKSREELAACLDEEIYAIICESFEELEIVDELARERGVRARVAVRVNPAFAVKGSGLTMGGKPRQFGIDEEQLFGLPGLRFEHLRVVGTHVYLGTRILDETVIAENTRRILDLAERLAARLDFPLEFVDVGGGLGVSYFDGERDLSVDRLTDLVNPVFAAFHDRHPGTRLVTELGRYLVAPAGTYLVRVRYVKTSVGERFAITDGGTHHHMAAVGIGSFVKRDFPLRVFGRPTSGPTTRWTVTGPLCTPNDTLARGVELPVLRRGDLLGVLRSGAYGPTASPTLFLGHGYPAEVLVSGGVGHLVRRRDRVADLLRQQTNAMTTGGDQR
ncbi:type III PLP-dependent enzyme [Plantactinospora sp. GCM10030261]|uniref:type III PLP-dependent enzyme n=1 Tax=Plantactinospora sp. GCM10030261 TaxID=3273420 RepID=UPI003612F5E0